ncbi:MAG: Ig-like domain-containing protein, partial [Nitrososphaeraceae archaeon]|nr:Ig-like domain-containing protein [Nitrososphaeraceae archaeon]
MAILFVTVSLLIVPDLTHTPVSGQADKSFKGTIAPFVPPSSSERLGSLPGNNFEFDDEEVVGDQEEEEGGGEEEIDRDELPVLTKQERDEFLSDNIDAIEADRLTVLSQEETIDDDIDPISSIVEEIVKNETIIGDEEFVPSPESSIIKFKDQNLEQILAAQEVAPEPDNQTISTTEEEELPLNVTEDDFEIEQADEISESESPDVDVQSFINETANEETTTTTAPPTDNETAITTEDTDEEEEEEEETTTTTAPPTDNETAITTEDSVEGKPSELLEMDPEAEDEIQDIKGEQQTEQAQQEEEDEAQTPQVEEESPNTEPIAQDGSVTTAQNQQLNIKLNANDADGDDLSFTIVDDPSNGQLGNVNPSTNTVTYTPDEDYSGEDNFTFIVNDGTIDSKEATVSITVEEEQQTEQAQQEEEDEAQTPQVEEESPNT